MVLPKQRANLRQDMEAQSKQKLEQVPSLLGGAYRVTLEIVDPDLQGLDLVDLVVVDQYLDEPLRALDQGLEDPSALWCQKQSHPRILVDKDKESLPGRACHRDLGWHPDQECQSDQECL